MIITKHFTATTFIINQGRVLLHLHKKLNIWIPMGGHIDENETPEEAARREAREECGLEIDFYHCDPDIDFGDASQLLRPMHIILENISPEHQHMDMIFYATSDSDRLSPRSGETDNLRWFTAEEIDSYENIPPNTRIMAIEALSLLQNMPK